MTTKIQILLPALAIIILVLLLVVESSLVNPAANPIKAKLNSIHMIDTLHHQIRAKEEELRNTENINKNFERMIQLVNILGQVDNFLTERTKAVIKKLAQLVEDEEEEDYNSINSNEV